MIDISQIDYSILDRPEILTTLFHPRPEWEEPENRNAIDVLIPVEKDVVVGGRFHMVGETTPNILHFHGNGEIVADYDVVGPMYNRLGVNLLSVDYRGYGRSTGRPTVTGMMRDGHVIFDFAIQWLKVKGYTGPLIVMGRSLGSASALELANHYRDDMDGLIIESGFAYAGPLLELLGADMAALGITEEQGLRNIDKITLFDKPTVVIHAEFDHIIPFSEGQALYDACPAPDKTLLKIPGANHNDIFFRGLSPYMSAIKTLAERISNQREHR